MGELIRYLKGLTIHITPLGQHKKVFFASDFHVGAPDHLPPQRHEQAINHWLDTIQPEVHALFLLGDIFDFWFEYKHVIPKGFVRLQSKLASLADQGIPVYLFTGNHDCWMQDYFQQELHIQVVHGNATVHIGPISMLVGHGDELAGNFSYRLLRQYVYNNPLFYTLGKLLHPTLLFALQKYISKQLHRKSIKTNSYLPDKDNIFQFCKERIEPYQHHDYYIFGHLHFPYSKPINEHSTYHNIGDWLTHCSYGVFDGTNYSLVKNLAT